MNPIFREDRDRDIIKTMRGSEKIPAKKAYNSVDKLTENVLNKYLYIPIIAIDGQKV